MDAVLKQAPALVINLCTACERPPGNDQCHKHTCLSTSAILRSLVNLSAPVVCMLAFDAGKLLHNVRS